MLFLLESRKKNDFTGQQRFSSPENAMQHYCIQEIKISLSDAFFFCEVQL